ncbi:MAG: hypothetical protein ISR65_09620 [Bacteriovoracaceae bacterium]|nr:hypothetical protein [Bacteriovoracaceae bacterium]
MKLSIYLVALVFLFGCASSDSDQAIDDDLSWIENEDFKPVRQIPFKRSKDIHNEIVSNTDSLQKETINRVPVTKLDDVSDSDNVISKGVALCYQGNIDNGLKVLDDGYELYRSHPSFWNQVGTCYFLKNELRKAHLYYSKARDIDKKYSPPVNNLGVIFQRQGRDQKAMAAFLKASKINPFSLTPIFNMAQMYLKYGIYDKAYQKFSALKKHNDKDIDVLNGIANVHVQKGEIDKAITIYESMEFDAMDFPHIALNYVVALKLKGRLEVAQSIFDNINKDYLGNMKNYYLKVEKMLRK